MTNKVWQLPGRYKIKGQNLKVVILVSNKIWL